MNQRDDTFTARSGAAPQTARRGPASGERDTPPAISGFDHSGGPSKVHYGGQAVIEGVMMRGPTAVATAVRTPSGRIMVRRDDYQSASRRHRLLRAPVLRGGLTLIESLSLGIKALNYSASVAMEEVRGEAAPEDAGAADSGAGAQDAGAADSGAGSQEAAAADSGAGSQDSAPSSGAAPGRADAPAGRSDWKTNATLTATMVFAFALGIVVFFWIPMAISGLLTDALGSESGILFNVVTG